MGLYDTLRSRGNQYGTATRPSGSDSWPPSVGTVVKWVVAQPIQDMLDQGRALGWTNLGTIGNTDHLRKHGDHTPWSGGKMQGIVYAKDTQDPDWLGAALLALCRMDGYHTEWIDFINVNGSQYNYAGQRVASSGDYHLHISVRQGHELTSHTLFTDLDRYHRGLPLLNGQPEDDMPTVEEFWGWNGIPNKSHSTTMTPAGALSNIEDEQDQMHARQKAMETTLNEVKAKVDALATGGVDLDALAAKVAEVLVPRLKAAAQAEADALK